MTYSHLDRTVVGAAVPIGETLKLAPPKQSAPTRS